MQLPYFLNQPAKAFAAPFGIGIGASNQVLLCRASPIWSSSAQVSGSMPRTRPARSQKLTGEFQGDRLGRHPTAPARAPWPRRPRFGISGICIAELCPGTGCISSRCSKDSRETGTADHSLLETPRLEIQTRGPCPGGFENGSIGTARANPRTFGSPMLGVKVKASVSYLGSVVFVQAVPQLADCAVSDRHH